MRLVLATFLGFAVLVAAAHAGEVRVVDHRVVFTAATGERNLIAVDFANYDVAVRDSGAPLVAGSGCAAIDDHAASCPPGLIRLDLGDGSDSADVRCSDTGGLCGSVQAHGGPGNDSLSAPPDRASVLDGGPGNDELLGGGDNSVLRGGPGDDVLRPYGSGGDTSLPRVDCGSGVDEFWPHTSMIVSDDCERFRDVLGTFSANSMRIARGRLILTSPYFRGACPLAWRFGDRGTVFRSLRIGHAKRRATLPMPRTGGPTPHLEARLRCNAQDGFFTLFRLHNPFWQPASSR